MSAFGTVCLWQSVSFLSAALISSPIAPQTTLLGINQWCPKPWLFLILMAVDKKTSLPRKSLILVSIPFQLCIIKNLPFCGFLWTGPNYVDSFHFFICYNDIFKSLCLDFIKKLIFLQCCSVLLSWYTSSSTSLWTQNERLKYFGVKHIALCACLGLSNFLESWYCRIERDLEIS